MPQSDYTEWANKYKKRIAREFIRRAGFTPSDHPAGIFTAGIPGVGKTEFTVELLKEITNNPVRIDMDELACRVEGYRPEIADRFRGAASILLSRIYDEVIKNKIDFVYDGTFAHGRAMENLERAIRKGYKIKIYYIHQDPKIAWNFTRDRELIEHRAIDKSGFIETYKSLQKNLRLLCDNYKDVTISLIIKDRDNKIGNRRENVDDLFGIIPKFLTDEEIAAAIL
ncbi:MAG: zeta toxin family protein [Candidatus Saccharimonadales bacterium]